MKSQGRRVLVLIRARRPFLAPRRDGCCRRRANLIARGLVFPAAMKDDEGSGFLAALAQRQSRGLINKRWRRRVTSGRDPGELRET